MDTDLESEQNEIKKATLTQMMENKRNLRISIADRLKIHNLNDDFRSIGGRIKGRVGQYGGNSIWGHRRLHLSLSINQNGKPKGCAVCE